MALGLRVEGKSVQDNGDVAVTLLMSGASIIRMSRGGKPQLQTVRKMQGKARALAEAGVIEQRDYVQLIRDNALSGNILRDRKELVEVVNVKELQTGDTSTPYVKEKVLATFLVDSNVDPE